MHKTTGKYFLLTFFIFLAPQYLFAQPKISYLLPDIGTPGMNTYMEIIAPINDTSDFGKDGFYFGNRGDIIQIVCANPSDTQYVRFGPCIVSWKGRMISTQVYVLPWVKANSTDWQTGIKIPIQVLFDGDLSNADTFYIVKPQNLSPSIVLTSPGTIGSGNGWGIRSRRGAMIVDSLILAATGVYNFSTTDCDPFTIGNQGYLPFTIISKGRISIASSSVLDASATGIDAGPGGGGGGNGLICDSRGGNGFTGGGGNSHWYNACTEGPPAGIGTGVAQNGLNGVIGGETSPQNEGGGGGTGHPFGAGGDAGYFNSGLNNPPGSYGGGKGGPDCCNPDEGGGGGGAFAQKGFDGGVFDVIHTSGGNLYGNAGLVPISGGSGGGGGNVNSSDISGVGAGSAGGGGGAIVLYGRRSTIKGTIKSIGADGLNSFNNNGAGGGGSGGAVICGGKLSLSVNTINLSGGVGGFGASLNAGQDGGSGSPGRVRFDGQLSGNPSISSRASKFSGPSTDASDTVAQTFTLTGSGNGNDIQILVRPLHGQWSQAAVVTNYARFGNVWTNTITLPGNDSVYFLAAAQKISNPSSFAYTTDPSFILSQAAANILFVLCPTRGVAAKDSTVNFGTVSLCADVFDTIIISNTGCTNSTLASDLADLSIGVSIVNSGKPSIPVQSKDTIVLHLHPNKVGAASTTLTVHTSLYDIPIPITWIGDASAPSLSIAPSKIDLGSISRCQDAFDTIVFQNLGCDSLPLSNSISDTTLGISFVRHSKSSLDKQSHDTVILHFQPKKIGSFLSALHIRFGNRDTAISIAGEGTSGAEAMDFTPPKLDFGALALCQTVFDTITIKSTGCDTLRLKTNVDDPNSGVTVIRLPNPLIPSGGSDTIIIAFRPHRTGAISANILLNYQGGDSIIAVSAIGVNDSTPVILSVDPVIQSFECDSKSFSITLKNPTCDSLTLISYSFSGKDTVDYQLRTPVPIGISSGVSQLIPGVFSPGDSGNRNAKVTFHLLRSDGSTIDTTVALNGFGVLENIRITLPPTLPLVQSYAFVTIPVSSLDSSETIISVFDFTITLRTDLLTPLSIDGSAGSFAGAAVDRFTVTNDSVSVRLRLASPKRIMPGELCAIKCQAFVADTLSTVARLQRTNFSDASSSVQCLSTTNIDSVTFTLDPQCGEPFISHYLALGKVPSIDGIFPNPSNGQTKIYYTLPVSSFVKIELFNQLGENLRTLSSGNEIAGVHKRDFNISDLPSGSYFFRMQIDGKSVMKGIELIK